MSAVKFMKMDFMKMRSQMKIMFLVAFVMILINSRMILETAYTWGVMYMIFMGIIFAAVPFSTDLYTANGFIKLLPASAKSRVYGRFLFSFVLLFGCAVLGSIVVIPVVLQGKAELSQVLLEISLLWGAGLMMNAVQYMAAYFFEIKNPQILSITRMIPGFVFFFGGNAVMEEMTKSSENIDTLNRTLCKIIEHKEVIGVTFFVISVLIMLFCMLVCAKREEVLER